MPGLNVYRDKGFYLSLKYSVCKLVKIVPKIIVTSMHENMSNSERLLFFQDLFQFPT